MMPFGWMIQFQIDTYVFMSSHSWIASVHTPAHTDMDLPHSSPEDATTPYYGMMDLSDISDIQDVMTTTSEEDIPDLEDIFGL